jgi:two-component sensor histidine kinase
MLAGQYTVAQMRLLTINTAQFMGVISQDSLDRDSLAWIACRITGAPFLLVYNEGFEKEGAGHEDELINSGKITEAVRELRTLDLEKKMRLQLELGLFYLHKSGTHDADLEVARNFISESFRSASMLKSKLWYFECLFALGEYYFQKGNIPESRKVYFQITTLAQQLQNRKVVARAWQRLGQLMPFQSPMKLFWLNKSLLLYKQLVLPEKEMEIMVEIASCYRRYDLNIAEKSWFEILALQRATGFRHSLYAEYELAYVYGLKSRYFDALRYAYRALDNLNRSGISGVSSAFYIRVGAAYTALNKQKEALVWFNKSLQHKSKETHIFWYKGLFFATTMLIELHRPGEALDMIDGVIKEYPPLTNWEKAQVFSIKGLCNERLGKIQLATENYTSLLRLGEAYPEIVAELSETYLDIARFYISLSNIPMARLFLKKGSMLHRGDNYILAQQYNLQFKIDSAIGHYRSAVDQHIRYKIYFDSLTNTEQRKKVEELDIQYGAEKKDRDIISLRKERAARRIKEEQNAFIRHMLIAAIGLLVVSIGLLFNLFRLKQSSNKKISTNNTALQQLVKEKEWLLKEVHHRVKNNLQIMASLLSTQSNYLENEAAIKAIRESQQRMHAISLLHHKLYQSEESAFIDLKDYVRDLIAQIENGARYEMAIAFEQQVADIQLDVAQAVPLALILNEAVTNAIKYAFHGKSSGRVTISVAPLDTNGCCFLTIGDNGCGFPRGHDHLRISTFSMRLMHGLSSQLGGTFRTFNNNGAHVELTFKISGVRDLDNNGITR